MRLHKVNDSDITSVKNGIYDFAFFACGYEQRSTFVARHVNRNSINNPIVLGFKESRDARQRKENDRYFSENWTPNQEIMHADDERLIFEHLQKLILERSAEPHLRILVDYSSMSRMWYAAVLNWARFLRGSQTVDIDFVYSVGTHKEPYPSMVISDILCIPGCEGGPIRLSKSIAVFGLGFEGMAALCVLDRLEPHDVYAYYANPAAFEDYPEKALEKNDVLVQLAKHIYPLPLDSVEQTFRALAEITSGYRDDADITLIPMGPKPHVLAAILLSLRFKEIACLRVSGKGVKPEDVEPTGDFVVTRIHFKPEPY